MICWSRAIQHSNHTSKSPLCISIPLTHHSPLLLIPLPPLVFCVTLALAAPHLPLMVLTPVLTRYSHPGLTMPFPHCSRPPFSPSFTRLSWSSCLACPCPPLDSDQPPSRPLSACSFLTLHPWSCRIILVIPALALPCSHAHCFSLAPLAPCFSPHHAHHSWSVHPYLCEPVRWLHVSHLFAVSTHGHGQYIHHLFGLYDDRHR